jgi:hypothetical protein
MDTQHIDPPCCALFSILSYYYYHHIPKIPNMADHNHDIAQNYGHCFLVKKCQKWFKISYCVFLQVYRAIPGYFCDFKSN